MSRLIDMGTMNKQQTMFDCTQQILSASAQYLLETKCVMKFDYKGKRYVLKVEEVDDGKTD